jgi:dTMP kinase
MSKGLLVTIEGLDGAGKTTLAQALLDEVLARGGSVELLREPGGVPLSERVRQIVKDPALEVCPSAEALLYAAARAQLVHERLRPLLAAGTLVLLDRFVDSSLAYQGAGRRLGVEQVRAVNLVATDGLTPDLTLLLDIAPEVALARARARAAPLDRMEAEPESFFERIATAYQELARAEPGRIRRIDATREPGQVLDDAVAILQDLLDRRPGDEGTV